MRLPEAAPATAAMFASEFVLRPIRPGVDDEAFVEVANDAFADHASPVRFTVEGIRFAMTRPGFDPVTISSAPAEDPGQLIGFARIEGFELDGHSRGRRARDRASPGVACQGPRAPAAAMVRGRAPAARRPGRVPPVEARNTGALRLYEAEGFEREGVAALDLADSLTR